MFENLHVFKLCEILKAKVVFGKTFFGFSDSNLSMMMYRLMVRLMNSCPVVIFFIFMLIPYKHY